MKVVIDIPEEYEYWYNHDKLLSQLVQIRRNSDHNPGLYLDERKTINMLIKAFRYSEKEVKE